LRGLCRRRKIAGHACPSTASRRRVSSVPGDGRIIRAEILAGPNPAPLRIAVLRQLGTGGFAGQCCIFVSETAPIPLVPNAVTTIPLDIAVERNTIRGFLAADRMEISAAVGTGTLPLRVVGSNNIFNEPIGNSRAGAFYPPIGSIPNDSGWRLPRGRSPRPRSPRPLDLVRARRRQLRPVRATGADPGHLAPLAERRRAELDQADAFPRRQGRRQRQVAPAAAKGRTIESPPPAP
jgi:hypothetical protein